MRLHSPESAVLSAVIFNALIIVVLIPLALRGVKFPHPALLRISCGGTSSSTAWGGLAVPFLGMKAIDLLVVALRLV